MIFHLRLCCIIHALKAQVAWGKQAGDIEEGGSKTGREIVRAANAWKGISMAKQLLEVVAACRLHLAAQVLHHCRRLWALGSVGLA